MARNLARFALSLPVIIAAVLLAFALGTYLGGRFFVPAGQGLAAPAEAMGYGLLASLISLAVASLAAVRLPMKALAACALGGALGLAGLTAFIAIRLSATEPAGDGEAGDMPAPRATTVPAPSSGEPDSERQR